MEANKRKTFPGNQQRDIKGNVVDLNYTRGEKDEIDASSDNYEMEKEKYPFGAFIIPLEAGTIQVKLLDQDLEDSNDVYNYSAEEVDAYIGRPFEGRIKQILAAGTTVTRIKVVG